LTCRGPAEHDDSFRCGWQALNMQHGRWERASIDWATPARDKQNEPLGPRLWLRYSQLINRLLGGGRDTTNFAPAIEVPANASIQDKLLAFSGRQP
jgi:hypothetical protein